MPHLDGISVPPDEQTNRIKVVCLCEDGLYITYILRVDMSLILIRECILKPQIHPPTQSTKHFSCVELVTEREEHTNRNTPVAGVVGFGRHTILALGGALLEIFCRIGRDTGREQETQDGENIGHMHYAGFVDGVEKVGINVVMNS